MNSSPGSMPYSANTNPKSLLPPKKKKEFPKALKSL